MDFGRWMDKTIKDQQERNIEKVKSFELYICSVTSYPLDDLVVEDLYLTIESLLDDKYNIHKVAEFQLASRNETFITGTISSSGSGICFPDMFKISEDLVYVTRFDYIPPV